MKMDVLHCKTSEMMEKEIWVYLLAYNLLRTVMAVAASENGVEPREIGFKGAKQTMTSFASDLRHLIRAEVGQVKGICLPFMASGSSPGTGRYSIRQRSIRPGRKSSRERGQNAVSNDVGLIHRRSNS
jgi:hypothetical protein